MKSENIKAEIIKAYNIEITSIEKVKNTYKINGDEGYCLKVINYQYPHFKFILEAMKYLKRRGFENILDIIRTKNDEDFIILENKYCYLTRWFKSRVSDYNNLIELANIAITLGKLHSASKGFRIPENSKPRVGFGKWIDTFKIRTSEIHDFKKRINQKAYKNKFDEMYLENFDMEIFRANEAINMLEESKYYKLIENQVFKGGFCHHDLANHNVLLNGKGDIVFIDFDYCMLDTNLHDLASLIVRANKFCEYNVEKTRVILESYSKVVNISRDEIEIMKGFIFFPQEFWQIGLQAYWEQQPWGEKVMLDKLNKYLNNRKNKEKIINDLTRFKVGGKSYEGI